MGGIETTPLGRAVYAAAGQANWLPVGENNAPPPPSRNSQRPGRGTWGPIKSLLRATTKGLPLGTARGLPYKDGPARGPASTSRTGVFEFPRALVHGSAGPLEHGRMRYWRWLAAPRSDRFRKRTGYRYKRVGMQSSLPDGHCRQFRQPPRGRHSVLGAWLLRRGAQSVSPDARAGTEDTSTAVSSGGRDDQQRGAGKAGITRAKHRRQDRGHGRDRAQALAEVRSRLIAML